MPEFIPKANTPDQLARYVLELQSKIPSTGEQVAGGVSQVARSIMDKIKAQQAQAAELKLAETKQRQDETQVVDAAGNPVGQPIKGKVHQLPQTQVYIDPATGKQIAAGKPGEMLKSVGQPNQWSYKSSRDGMDLTEFLKLPIGKTIQDKISNGQELTLAEGQSLEDFGVTSLDWKDPNFYQRLKAWFGGRTAEKTAKVAGSIAPAVGKGGNQQLPGPVQPQRTVPVSKYLTDD